MLQSIRDKTTGLLAYVIVGLISVPFLLWGVNEYLGGGGERLVAKVDGEDISYAELKRATQMQQQRLQQMFGGNVPAGVLEGGAMQQTALNGLIKASLLRQYTHDSGFRTSDAEVIKSIKTERAFHVDGMFSETRFNQLLDAQRMSKTGFENSVREDLQRNQFQQALADSSFVTAENKQKFLALRGEQRLSQYLVLEAEKFKDSVAVSDQQVKQHFENNTQLYLSDERVKLAYVELDARELEKRIDVNEQALRQLYEQEQNAYATPESRKAAHILIEAAGGSEAKFAEAEEKAKQLYTQIQGDQSFAAIAEQYSADKLSASKGGDLGFIAPGDMDAEFEKALFELNINEVSEPIKSAKGYHLIQLAEIKPRKVKSFDTARAAIEAEYRGREASKLLVDMSEQLLTISYESPESLEPVADALGSKIQFSDWITRAQGSGIGSEIKIRNAAFVLDVLNGKNSDVVELTDDRQIVIRIAEHEEARPKPLETVQESIELKLKSEAAQALVRKTGEENLAKLEAGATLAEIAKAFGETLPEASLVERNTPEILPEVVTAIFRANAPENKQGSIDGLVLANGDYALIQVKEITTPEVTLTDTTELTASAVLASNNQREFNATYRAIESRADLEVFQDVLNPPKDE